MSKGIYKKDIVFFPETKEEKRKKQLRKAQRTWRKKHPEKVSENKKKFDKYYYRYYRLENVEKIKEYDREYKRTAVEKERDKKTRKMIQQLIKQGERNKEVA